MSTWAIRTNTSHSSGLSGSLAICGARPLSCQSCSHLTNLPAPNGLKGNKGSFPLPPLELKWHGSGTWALGRAIYTWHLLSKCAHWPLDNAHSLTFSGLFSWRKGTNLSEFFGTLQRRNILLFLGHSCEKATQITSFSLSFPLFISVLSVCPAVPWESMLRLNYRFVLIALTRISHGFRHDVGFSLCNTVHVISDNCVHLCVYCLQCHAWMYVTERIVKIVNKSLHKRTSLVNASIPGVQIQHLINNHYTATGWGS